MEILCGRSRPLPIYFQMASRLTQGKLGFRRSALAEKSHCGLRSNSRKKKPPEILDSEIRQLSNGQSGLWHFRPTNKNESLQIKSEIRLQNCLTGRSGAVDAPERQTEERTRSVSVGRDAVKQEATQYLSQHYTNVDGDMICQLCKGQLPFKLDDGTDYFETVEFLPELKNRHYQNYLALCPNHSAMFRYTNGSAASLIDMVKVQIGNEIEVVLAQIPITIYFTKTHLADLKTVINADAEVHSESSLSTASQ